MRLRPWLTKSVAALVLAAQLSPLQAAQLVPNPTPAPAESPYAMQTLSGPVVRPTVTPFAGTLGATPSKGCLKNATQVAADLQVIANRAPAFVSQYGTFLSYLPCNREVRVIAAGTMQPQPTDQTASIPVWGNSGLGVVQVKRMNTLLNTTAMKAAPSQRNATFIGMTGLGGTQAYVPEEVAWAAASAFINGLVTRMLLGKVADAVETPANPLNVPSPGLPQFKFNTTVYEQPGNWTAATYGLAIQNVAAANPIQADSIFYGWHFAEELEASGDTQLQQAVERLLSHRLTTRQLGEAVGYTLSYLQGYEESQSGADKSNAAILDKMRETLLNQSGSLASQDGFDARTLNDKFFSAVVIGLHAPESPAKDALRAFLIGYNQGSIRSAEVVYADVFLLAYGKGYHDGFRDGYATGFAEGHRAGKASAGGFFGQLNRFLDNVNGITRNIRDAVGTVAGVVGKVAGVVGAIGSVFGF